MLNDERKWEKFQKISSWFLIACAFGFLVVVGGLRLSREQSVMESALFISGMLLLVVSIAMLLMILVVLVILDIRELGLGQALFLAVKTFFVYLGVSVLLVLLSSLARGSGIKLEMAREIFLFALAMDIGAYLGRFSRRRLPKP